MVHLTCALLDRHVEDEKDFFVIDRWAAGLLVCVHGRENLRWFKAKSGTVQCY